MTIVKSGFQYPIPVTDGGTGATSAAAARAALGITIGARDVDGTASQIVITNSDGSTGNPTVSIASNPILPGVESVTIPRGDASNRPGTPAGGEIRYNIDSSLVEFYSDGQWTSLPLAASGEPVISTSITVDQADLASGGLVDLITAYSPAASYRLTNIQINGFDGVNFSGGGGDRDLLITDGSSQWSIIPASVLQSQVNAQWGSTEVPFPASISLNQSSSPGADIYAIYLNGTTDYTIGSLIITLIYTRVI